MTCDKVQVRWYLNYAVNINRDIGMFVSYSNRCVVFVSTNNTTQADFG